MLIIIHIYLQYRMLTSESFHLKSAKEVQNYTVPAQILMKMHICDPCDPNRKNPTFFI